MRLKRFSTTVSRFAFRRVAASQRTNIYAIELTVGTDIQVFENEADKAQVHKNPLEHYKPNLFVSGATVRHVSVTLNS